MISFRRLASEYQAVAVRFDKSTMDVQLADGRTICVPLSFYPTLLAASPAQRQEFEIFGEGTALEWEALDLQLSVESIVAGRREHVPPPGFRERVAARMKAAGLSFPK